VKGRVFSATIDGLILNGAAVSPAFRRGAILAVAIARKTDMIARYPNRAS